MKAVENWVRDIVFYMIFVTMVMNLLPDPKYEKYLRLFAGAVMILLAFGPVLRITGMETAMAGIFEKITFENDVRTLKEELGLDSLSLVSVIVGLESMYGIEFDEGDLDPEALTDVKSLVKLVEKSL